MNKRKNNTIINLILFCTVLCFSNSSATSKSYEQIDSLEIVYIANQGFLLSDGTIKVLIDGIFTEDWGKYHKPSEEILLRERNADFPFNDIDFILITHEHADHLNKNFTVEHLQQNTNCRLLCNSIVYNKLATVSTFSNVEDQVIILNPTIGNPVDTIINGVEFKVCQLYHSGETYTDSPNSGYIFTIGNYQIFHFGDAQTREIEDYQNINLPDDSIDVAFVPRWYFNTEYGDMGIGIINLIQAKLLVFTHANKNKFSDYKQIILTLPGSVAPVYLFENPMQKIVVSDSFKIDTLNWSPLLKNPIDDVYFKINEENSFQIPENTFIDFDSEDTLKYTFLPGSGNDLPQWLSFDSTSMLLKGKPVVSGTIDIVLSATDKNGATAKDTFQIVVNGEVKVNVSDKNNFVVYPNPAQNTLQIEYPDLAQKEINYEIIDITGKTLQQGVIKGNMVDISKLYKGIFILNLNIKGEIINKKIIVD